MLVIKEKSISLLWELNSIFKLILREKFYCFDPQHGRLVTWLKTKNLLRLVSLDLQGLTLKNTSNFSCWTNWIRFHRCEAIYMCSLCFHFILDITLISFE